MSYLYKALSGSVFSQTLKKQVKAFMSPKSFDDLDSMVEGGLMGKESLSEFSLACYADVYTHRFLKINTAKAQMMTVGDTASIGVSMEAGKTGGFVRYAKGGQLAVQVGDAILADATNVVVGINGTAIKAYAAQTTLLTLSGASTDDFTNTVWGSNGLKITVVTSTNTDPGKTVTLYFINSSGAFTIETVTLNQVDSTTAVTSSAKCLSLVGYKVDSTFTGTLLLKGGSNNCVSQATPTGGKVYGFLATGTTSGTVQTTDGHVVTLTSGGGAITAYVVIQWLTSAGATVYEVVSFASASTATSTNAYNKVIGIFIGGDTRATNAWTVTIAADGAGTTLGVTTGGETPAGGIALINYNVPAMSTQTMPFGGITGTITAGATRYIGPVVAAEQTTEVVFFVVPFAGKITGFQATFEVAPASSNTVALTVRNNKSDTSMTFTVTGTATSGQTLANAFTVKAGDKISIKAVASGSNSASGINVSLNYQIGV